MKHLFSQREQSIKTMKKLFLFIIIVLMLAACQPNSVAPVEVTRVVKETVLVTQVVEKVVVVTATPVPATATPEPTPTVAYVIWNGQNVVDAFKSAGLEAEGTYQMTKDDYGLAPLMTVEGIRFLIPSLCSDCGGRIMVFDDPTGLEATKAYYEEMGKSSAALFSWVFVKDNILVQINGDLPEDKALQYQATLETLQ